MTKKEYTYDPFCYFLAGLNYPQEKHQIKICITKEKIKLFLFQLFCMITFYFTSSFSSVFSFL